MTARPAEVLIPSFNRSESLRTTLESLRTQTVVPAVRVVDNGSTDGTPTMLDEDFPWVRHLRLEENLGFGRALNRGVAESKSDSVIFLNNDAVADSRFVESLLLAQRQSGASMVAGCLLTPSGDVESLGIEIDRSLNAYDVGFGLASPADYDGPPPLGPCGGAALFDRVVFERLGGFDEAIFAYLEDVDLAIRLRLEGASRVLAIGAVAWHHHSATLGARSAAKNELLGYARAHLRWKYGKSQALSHRLQGFLTDALVYTGKAAIDGDLGAFRGWRRAQRANRGSMRPARNPGMADIPMAEVGVAESLHRRLARRRS